MDPFAERELERKRIIQDTRIAAAEKFSKKPLDADSLTWAGILLELSQFGKLNESTEMVEGKAMSKLHTALTINPTNDEAVWYLGKAHKAKAFLNPDHDEAKIEFDLAFRYFIKAVELSPGNEDYRHSLKICAQHAPEMHKMRNMQGEVGLVEEILARESGSSSSVKGRYDLKCELLGGVILAVGLVAWIVMTKST